MFHVRFCQVSSDNSSYTFAQVLSGVKVKYIHISLQ